MAAPLLRTFSSNLRQKCSQLRAIPSRTVFNMFRKNKGEKTSDEGIEKPVVAEYNEAPPAPQPSTYNPPKNVAETVLSIANAISGKDVKPNTQFNHNTQKFKVLTECMRQFNYEIPSNQLGNMSALGDVIEFYNTARVPASVEVQLKEMDLPKNLHLRLEPMRFTDETKDHFGGKTAFPGRDTIVTSLKYRNIYKGYTNPPKYKKKYGFKYA